VASWISALEKGAGSSARKRKWERKLGFVYRDVALFSQFFWGFLKWGCPNSWMVYFRENPIKIDDLGVPP